MLVSRGVRVVPAASLEGAASIEADYRIGERGSAKVAGFDFGNSPTELFAANLEPGTTAALSTTNGTRVLDAAEGAPLTLTGAFVNATALAAELCRISLDVVVVGCGWEGKRALEDELASGAILHRLEEAGVSLDERARRVARSYTTRPNTDALAASAARRLRRLGHEADAEFCLREDTLPVVPMLSDGGFVTMGTDGKPGGVPLRKDVACYVSTTGDGSRERDETKAAHDIAPIESGEGSSKSGSRATRLPASEGSVTATGKEGGS